MRAYRYRGLVQSVQISSPLMESADRYRNVMARIIRDTDGDLTYVEHRTQCTDAIIRLFPDPTPEEGWTVEEIPLDEAERSEA